MTKYYNVKGTPHITTPSTTTEAGDVETWTGLEISI